MALSSPYAELYRNAAKETGLSAELLEAQGKQESGWNPLALNKKSKAEGIAQFVPDTAKWLGLSPEDVRNPAKAIPAQAKYMKSLKQQFGSDELALVAYNWGPGNLRKHLRENGGLLLKSKIPKETRDYLANIHKKPSEDYPKPKGFGDVPAMKEGLGQLDALEQAQRDADTKARERGTLTNIGMAVRGAYTMGSPDVSFIRNQIEFEDVDMGEPREEGDESFASYIFDELGKSGAEADFLMRNAVNREHAKKLSETYLETRNEEVAELMRHGNAVFLGGTLAAGLASPLTLLTGGVGKLATAGKLIEGVGAAKAASAAVTVGKAAAGGAAVGLAYGYGLHTQSAQEFHPIADAGFGAAGGAILGAISHHLRNAPPKHLQELRESMPNPNYTELPAEESVTHLHPFQQTKEADVVREYASNSYGPRMDVTGRLKKHDIPELNTRVSMVSRDPTMKLQRLTVEEDFAIRNNKVHTLIGETSKLAKSHGIDVTNKDVFTGYSKAVARAIQDDGAYNAAPPAVKAVADRLRDYFKEIAEEAYRNGLTDTNLANRNYYPVKLSANKIDSLAAKLGKGLRKGEGMRKVEQMAARAYEESKRSAAFIKTTKEEYAAYLKSAKSDPKPFDSWLHDKARGYGETLINSNMLDLTEHLNFGQLQRGRVTVNGKSSHLQHAERFDRGHRITLEDGTTFAIDDLRDFNLHNDLKSYHRSMSPDMAFMRVTNETMEGFVESTAREMAKQQGSVNHNTIKGILDDFSYMVNSAVGKSPGGRGIIENLANFYSRSNYVRKGGWFGFNQIGEHMQNMGLDGGATMVKMLKHMGVEDFIERARAGDPKYKSMFKAIEMVFGGADPLTYSRFDMSHHANPLYGGANLTLGQKIMNKLDSSTQAAARMQGRLSGFEPMVSSSVHMTQLGAMEAIHSFVKGSTNKFLKQHFTPKRLANYGATKAEWESLEKALKRAKGDGFEALGQLNAEDFQTYQRMARRISEEFIQPNSRNMLPRFLTETPLMRLSAQFMSYPIAAWAHQALRAYRYADRVTALKLLGGFMGNAMAYVARMYLQSLTKREREREDFVEKYMSPEAVAMAGITRISAASIIPNILNTPLSIMGIEVPGVSSGRTTGNDASLLGGSLPQDIGAITALLGSTRRAFMEDEDFSDSDVNKLGQLIVPNHMLTQLMWKTLRDTPIN